MKTPRIISFLFLIIPSVSLAQEMPKRRAGLWEMTISSGQSSQVAKHCTDAATDEKLIQSGNDMLAKIGGQCEKNQVKREGSNYVIESACTFGPTKITSKTVFVGDFNRQYTATTTSTFNPPIPGAGAGGNSKITGRWLGPCTEGQSPGEIILPDGKKVSLDQLSLGN